MAALLLSLKPTVHQPRWNTLQTHDVYWARRESMSQNTATAGFAVLLVALSTALVGVQPAAPGQLYVCMDGATVDTTLTGMSICDTMATSELMRRAETDNLQVREGARVVELEPTGMAAVAGLQAGDVVYRVGGVDVTSAESAADRLAMIGTESDTVVNFLRGGRPYRVKLRRH